MGTAVTDHEIELTALNAAAQHPYANRSTLTIPADAYSYYPYTFQIVVPNVNIPTNQIIAQYHYKFMECYQRFILVQNTNYKIEYIRDLELSLNQLDEIYYRHRYPLGWIYWSYRYNNGRGLIKEIRYRIEKHKRFYFLQTRKTKAVLGKFYDSLSPQMIHKILTWLKKDNPTKFGKIKRGPKEDILHSLHKLDIKIDANFCCKFIDQVNPVPFLKEFGVELYKTGKRQTNTVLREVLKKKFYNRERNYLRCAYITPELRGLPENVENNIISFLIS